MGYEKIYIKACLFSSFVPAIFIPEKKAHNETFFAYTSIHLLSLSFLITLLARVCALSAIRKVPESLFYCLLARELVTRRVVRYKSFTTKTITLECA
jgi:hypothetical protein